MIENPDDVEGWVRFSRHYDNVNDFVYIFSTPWLKLRDGYNERDPQGNYTKILEPNGTATLVSGSVAEVAKRLRAAMQWPPAPALDGEKR